MDEKQSVGKTQDVDMEDAVADSDDESGSESSEDEEKEESELKSKCDALQAQIKENPYMYDNHVELIKSLKTLGDLEQLRTAREHMSTLFPLSEDLWLEWLKDESSLVSEPSDREQVTKLYRRAVKDYLSVPVWLEFVQFAIGGMGQDGIQSVRHVFDEAITACGLHVTKGANLWEAYREFESAILSGLLPDPGSMPTKEQENKFSEQHDKVSNLFKRQLTVPLLDMEDTWKEYSDWLQEEPDTYCKQTYKKAQNKLNKIKPYEDKVLSAESPRLAEYQEYIQFEEKDGDPARIQCLYERAIQENCLNPTLWLQYTKYLDHTLKVTSVSIPVYERSVRNCPWCVQLWQNYIVCLERAGRSHDTLKDVFEAALTSGFSQGAEYLSLWTTFIDYLRRKINWTEDNNHTEELDTFRLTVEKAIEQIDNYGAEGDPNGTLRQFWALIEAKYCKKMEKARTLWAEVMAAGKANEAALWMEYYRFERAYGDNKHCRKVLQRALNSVTDWPESIVDAYINFERAEGTLEQYDLAVNKCEAQMTRINERREKAEADAPVQNKKRFDKNQQRKVDNKQKQKPNIAKQKQTGYQEQQIKPYKRKSEDTTEPGNGFKVPDLPPAKVAKSEPPPGFKGRSAPPPGFQDKAAKSAPPPGFKGEKPATSTEDGQNNEEKPMEQDESESKKTDMATTPASDSESRTVFVSNLSFTVDEDKLKAFFTKCGPIDEIRLVKTFTGKSKGYAYVQFADQLAVIKALTYDRTAVENRPMYVSKYEDRSHKNKADFKYSTNLEKNKLFVKNLPFTCTKEALETLFSQHGELKEVRLVTYKSGQPKGLAYVEYVDEQCAAQAILKTDGIQIGEHAISVALSNPPTRKDPSWKREETSFVPSLGGGKKDTLSRGNARTQVMLMPRSVAKKPQAQTKPTTSSTGTTQSVNKDQQASSTQNDSTSSENTTKGMSNTDFRKFLLKK